MSTTLLARPAVHPSELPTATKLLAFGTMSIGFFIALLDIQIVAASLQDIGGGLSAGADETAWVQTSYLIAEIVVIPLSGWLSRVMSTRWLFCASATGFTITSLLCGWAWNIQSMIVFRALQGFLGGSMIPTVFTTAFIYFSMQQRVVAAATIGAISSLAPTLGPTIGGWITDNYSWHWLFFINLVPGIFVAVAVPLLVRVDKPEPSLLRGADYLGIVLMAAFLGCLEYTLEEGPRWDWFGDPTIRTTAWIAGLSGVAFIWRSLTFARPIVDLRALKGRNFSLGCCFSFVTGIGIFATIYLTPLFLARARGFSALEIGVAVCSTGAFQICAIPIYTTLARWIDMRWLMMFGFACFTLSMWDFTFITHDWGWRELLLPQAFRGFSQQFAVAPTVTPDAGQSVAGAAEAGIRTVQPDAQPGRRDRHRRVRDGAERPHQPALPAFGRSPDHDQSGDGRAGAARRRDRDRCTRRRRRVRPHRGAQAAVVAGDLRGADTGFRRCIPAHHDLLRAGDAGGAADAPARGTSAAVGRRALIFTRQPRWHALLT